MLSRKIRINRDIGNILFITLPVAVDLECAAMTEPATT